MKNRSSDYKWTFYSAIDLKKYSADWDGLRNITSDLPILDANFFLLLLEYYGNGKEKLAVCYRGNELFSMTIIHPSKTFSWQTFQPSQAPLGAFVMKDFADIESLISSLQREIPGYCMVFGLTQQDPEIYGRPEETTRMHLIDYIQTASIKITQNFSSYWDGRGKNLRHNIKRQSNRLVRENVVTRMEKVSDPLLMKSAIADYALIESRGWKAKEGTALHPENVQGKFYIRLFDYLANRGEAVVFRLFYLDKLVATDLCVHRNGVFIILKTTYDESEQTTSPTMLMRYQMFEYLFEEKVKKIEFYGKLMDWHTKWADDVRTMYHANFYRWPALANILVKVKRIRHDK